MCPKCGQSVPDIGHTACPRRNNEFGEQPARAVGALVFEALHARTRRSSQSRGSGARALVGDDSLRSARTRRPPVTSDAGLSLLTTQCRFFEGWSRGPRILVPSSLVVTSAALTPGSLRLESVCTARNPRCATWSRLPGRDAIALSAWTPGPERGFTAARWISIPPPFVTGSRRRVDHDPAAKWICLSPPLKDFS